MWIYPTELLLSDILLFIPPFSTHLSTGLSTIKEVKGRKLKYSAESLLCSEKLCIFASEKGIIIEV